MQLSHSPVDFSAFNRDGYLLSIELQIYTELGR